MKKLNLKKLKPKKKLVIKEKKLKKEKVKKERKKFKITRKILYTLLIIFVTCCIIGILGLAGFFVYISQTAPEFDPKLLYEKESSLVYDKDGNLLATLGVEQREKVTYDELSEVLIDAIIATEDSRFFQHNGFDFPRFLKASLGQVLGSSDAGGASTLTMQVSKNTFTDTTSSGIKGIIRKFTDIYMSIFKIEKHYTKEEILEFYVNAPFMGSSSYGVEQACKKYFGKTASDVSLPEAALIAGLFQAPSAYDPYVYPEDAEDRRNTVLKLMERHGYITKEERIAAESISVKSLLATSAAASVNPYQGFIDTAVEEARDITGNDPYNVPMLIYTTMDAGKQNVINSIYDGSAGFEFKDEKLQFAVAAVDNDTGAIIAIGAGRNKVGELSQNYATMISRHPGSTAKPIFDYGPGIEYEKWSTYTPFFNEADTTYSNGGVMHNATGTFTGMMTLRSCLANSINTCALQAFQRLDKSKIFEFVTNLGIQPESSEYGAIYESHSIGAFNGVNPVQLAAAYAAFGNNGYYKEAYSVQKIEYRDSEEIYEHEVVKKKAMSEQTAYLISMILKDATPWTVRVSGTDVATKTGTSSYDSAALREKGLSNAVIQDSWVASYSPTTTIVLWLGYDELTSEYNITSGQAGTARITLIGILDNGIMTPNARFSNPGGIVGSRVEWGTIPAQLPSEYTPEDLIGSYLFVSGSEPTEVSTRYSKLSNPTNLKVSLSESEEELSVNWTSPGIPSAIDTTYLTNYFTTGYGKWAQKYLNERIDYNNNNIGKFGFEIYLAKGSIEKYIGFTEKTSYTIDLSEYKGYDTIVVRSAYTIYKANKSSGISKKYSESNLSASELSISFNNVSLVQSNDSWNGSKSNNLIVSLDGNAISGFNASITLDKIVDSTNKSVTPDTIRNNTGTYKATYSVTIEYLGYTFNTEIVNQTVIVTGNEASTSTTP